MTNDFVIKFTNSHGLLESKSRNRKIGNSCNHHSKAKTDLAERKGLAAKCENNVSGPTSLRLQTPLTLVRPMQQGKRKRFWSDVAKTQNRFDIGVPGHPLTQHGHSR